MSDLYTLVIGSALNSHLPSISLASIYTANGAAELALKYKHEQNVQTTAVIGQGQWRRMDVIKRVESLIPNRIILRTRCDDMSVFSKSLRSEAVIDQLDRNGFELQKKVFGLWPLIYCEIFRLFTLNPFIWKSELGRLKKYEIPTGFSTGMFSVLLALIEHPENTVIIAGITMSGGMHFYESGGMSRKRALADRVLFERLPEDFKKRLVTTDSSLSVLCGIPKF